LDVCDLSTGPDRSAVAAIRTVGISSIATLDSTHVLVTDSGLPAAGDALGHRVGELVVVPA
jgi:hypothetical protein